MAVGNRNTGPRRAARTADGIMLGWASGTYCAQLVASWLLFFPHRKFDVGYAKKCNQMKQVRKCAPDLTGLTLSLCSWLCGCCEPQNLQENVRRHFGCDEQSDSYGILKHSQYCKNTLDSQIPTLKSGGPQAAFRVRPALWSGVNSTTCSREILGSSQTDRQVYTERPGFGSRLRLSYLHVYLSTTK
jgi:hypothetical protein